MAEGTGKCFIWRSKEAAISMNWKDDNPNHSLAAEPWGSTANPPDRGARMLVVGQDVVESREERKGLGKKNWSICSELSRAGVSNEPSRWDSKEMT